MKWINPFLRRFHLVVARLDRKILKRARKFGWVDQNDKVLPKFKKKHRAARKRMKVYRSEVDDDLRILDWCLNTEDIVRRCVPMPREDPTCGYRTDAAGSKRKGGLGGYATQGTSCVEEPQIPKQECDWFAFDFKKGDDKVCSGEPRYSISFLEGLASLCCFAHFFLVEKWISMAQREEVVAESDSNVFCLAMAKMKSKSKIHEVVRQFCFKILQNRMWGFKVRHLPGVLNEWSDAISRGKFHGLLSSRRVDVAEWMRNAKLKFGNRFF